MRAVLRPDARIGALLLVACAALAAVLPAALGAQQIPDGYEQGIFQLTITDLPSTPIAVLVGPGGELLFPVASILRAAEVPFEQDSSGYAVAVVDESRHSRSARVDTIAREVVRAAYHAAASATELIPADGDIYLAPHLVAVLLDAEVEADFGRLELRIDPVAPVPAQLAQEAERRRQLALIRAGATAAPILPPIGLRPVTGAGVLHYSLSSATPNARDATVVSLESGFALFGGLAAVGYTGSTGVIVADPALTVRYERFIPERNWISFVRAGDIFSEGAFVRSMRGVSVTNRPLRREGNFQDLLIDPEVPPGYEIEVYQGGQLIAFSDRATQEPIRVPLTYGRTDLELRMIAPSGEVVTTDLLFGIPQSQVREGALEYSLGGGECHVLDCTLLFAGADYGVRRWLTLGAGHEAQHDSTGWTNLPFGRALFSPAGGWIGEARVVAGRQYSASAQYRGVSALTGNLGIDVRTSEVPRATLLPQSETRWDTRGEIGYGRHRALGRLGGMAGAGVDRWALGYVASIPRGVVVTQLESFAGRDEEITMSAFQLLRARLLGSALTASGRLGVTRSGVRAVEAGASGSWGNSFFANLSLGWDRIGGMNVTLSFSRILPLGQLAGVVSGARDDARATLRADGALAFDEVSAVEPAAYTGVGFAGIDAFVFRDANSNGAFDEGEQPAAGVAVQAGERTATSDESGHARIWGLIPWEKTAVRASSDWADAHWAPADPERLLRPVANVFNAVSMPLVATRELIATVIPGEGIAGSAGIGYRLLHERSGRTWQGLTLSDGSIYVTAVPVGDYVLELNEEALRFLRARPVGPLRFTVGGVGEDEFVYELPPIVLERQDTAE